MAKEAGETSPHLDEAEQRQAAEHAAPKALVIHEVVREEGETEIARSNSSLIWSGVAAGLSMGFSLLTLSFLQAALPDTPQAHLISAWGYCVGFIITILGKQQLFTESTLTAMLPLFVRRDLETFLSVMRMWGVVLCANLLGTAIIAGLISVPGIFSDPVHSAMLKIGTELMDGPWIPKFLKAIFSGWLIALMVWILPSARSARFFVILLLTYVVAVGRFPHIIAGSVEAAFTVFAGKASIGAYFTAFLLPTLSGNVLGGVALAALLNHAPLMDELTGEIGGAKKPNKKK